MADNQREVKLEVWEQAGSVASEELEHNTHIGEGVLRDLPARPAGAPFQVVFHMTETGLLEVHGREAGSGSEVRFEIQIGGLDEAGVQEAASAVARHEVSGQAAWARGQDRREGLEPARPARDGPPAAVDGR